MVQPFLLVTISSPSGAGKTTLCQRFLADFPDLRFSVSTTTRSQRAGEVDGVHYHFVSEAQFDELVSDGAFVEWAKVHGHRYGTTHAEIERRRRGSEGGGILFDVDYRGSGQIKAAYPEAVTIFLLPPSMAELERRIRTRGTDSDEQIALRLANARQEIERYRQFDYIVVNDDVDLAYEQLKSIYLAEQCRGPLQHAAAERLLGE